jgi:hypothetical protein
MSADEIQFRSADYTDYADFGLGVRECPGANRNCSAGNNVLISQDGEKPQKSNLRNLRIDMPSSAFICVHLRFVFVILFASIRVPYSCPFAVGL